MKPKTKFINRVISLAKKYSKDDIYDAYLGNKSAGFYTKRESISMAFMSFESKLYARIPLTEDEITFMKEVVKSVEEFFNMKTFEWEETLYSFDEFSTPYIFLLIVKIFIDESTENELQYYIRNVIKYL